MKSYSSSMFALVLPGVMLLVGSVQARAQIMVPAGNTLALSVYGDGFQGYVSAADPSNAGAFVWSFVAPDARLFTDSTEAVQIGIHFAGPTWQSSVDGSTVVGLRMSSLTSPNPDSIPQLLLIASSHTGAGLFSSVSYIQRLDTLGGNAPSAPPTGLGQTSNVRYSATYRFFTTAAVPEPGSVALLTVSGLFAAGLFARRRARAGGRKSIQ